MIADEHGVESLAGIMGGEDSGCDENTTDVLIESALWNAINIAQTGRKLGINSDARYRFERGVDPAFMVPGLELATQMVIDLCGGDAVGDRRRRRRRRRRPRDRFPAERGQAPRRHRRAAGRDASASSSHLGFIVAGSGRDREGRGAVVAHRRARQGRHRRGSRAHRRRRQACR